MKITDKLVKKIGADKLLHFCVAGWIVSLSDYFGDTFAIIASILVIVMSIAKEKFWDDEADWLDLWAAMTGIIISWAIIILA